MDGDARMLGFPTTESQREIWTACQLGTDASLAYSESVTLILRGRLEVEAMVRALEDLELRHESLRLKFDGDGLTATVHEQGRLEVAISRLEDDAGALAKAKEEAVTRPFDLEGGPLFRATIVVGDEEHYVLLTAHHMVCDGWSMAILMRDLGALYSARCEGRREALPLPPQFTAFALDEAAYQTSEAQAADVSYWRQRFAGGTPVMDLPGDGTRPKLRSFTADRIDLILPEELCRGVKKIAAKQRASFFMGLLGAYQVLLWKILGTDSVVTAVPAAAQAAGGLFDLVGHCVNTLPVLGSPAADESFISYLARTRQAVLSAYEHQRTTFGRVLQVVEVERDASRIPLAPFIFNVDKKFESKDLAFKGLTASYASNPRRFEAFEIFINVAEANGQCVVECQFNTDLYSHAFIQSHLDSYVALLESMVLAPEAPLKTLNWAPLAQLEQQYFEWNQTGEPPQAATLLEEIEARIARHPEKTAIIAGDESLSYGELGRRIEQWARLVQHHGVRHGDFVGVALERSIRVLPILLGIMRAGGCYVPLDPEYPADRLSYMVTQTGCRLILADPRVAGKVPVLDGVKAIPTDASSLDELPAASQAMTAVSGDTLAYVIFTSGSTGLPKGVLVPHRGVVNLLHCMARKPGFDAEDRLLAVTTLSFDVSVAELFLPLIVGGTLVIASGDDTKDGRLLIDLIERHRITFMSATPSTWRMLLDSSWQGAPLKAITTGEALPFELGQELLPKVGSLWNYYGPTEVTVWATGDQVLPAEPITIGRALDGISLYVVDRHGMPVPRHIPGELYLGGVGVTRGYVGRPDLTAERFVLLPGIPELTTVYKTGDLVRLRDDAKLDYLGRNDNQVKVRGFRIELGEIETVVGSFPGMTQALLMVREDRVGDKRLVAYAQGEGAHLTEEALAQWCRDRLPAYMVPQHFVILDALPLLPNGKVNRKALKAPSVDVSSSSEEDEPRTELERQLATLWATMLGLEKVPVTRSFYDLGGHSLLAMRMLAAAQKTLGVVITLRTLLEHNSVRALAKVLGQADAAALAPIPKATDGRRARLSIIQERVYYLDLLNPKEIINLVPGGRIIRGPFDAKLFAASVKKIVERHPLLRSIAVRDPSGPMMLVRDQIDFALEPIDLSHLSPAEQEERVREGGHRISSTPMDVHSENLFRLLLFKLSDDVHVFATVFHHLIWDGWCFDIFWGELHQLYMAGIRGEEARLPEPGCRYLDFSLWHRQQSASPDFLAQLPFWTSYLKGLVGLELTTDYPRPARKTSQGKRLGFSWDRRQTDLMQKLAQSEKTTIFVVMLALYKYLLSLYSGQRDIAVGTPVQGRGHPDLAQVIGYFVNTLVLRTDASAITTFRELVRAVKKSAEDAFRHQDVAFEDIVKSLDLKPDPSRTTLYSAMFVYQDTSNRPTDWRPLVLEHITLPQKATGTDLVLWARKSDSGIAGGVDFRTDLFSDERVAAMLEHLTLLLETLTTAPERPIYSEPVLLPEAASAATPAAPADLAEQIAAAAGRAGASPFLRSSGQTLTGDEFLAAIRALAGEATPALAAGSEAMELDSALRQVVEVTARVLAAQPIPTRAGALTLHPERDGKIVAALKASLRVPARIVVPRELASPDDVRWLVFALVSGSAIELQDLARDNALAMRQRLASHPDALFHLTVAEAANLLASGHELSDGQLVISGGDVPKGLLRLIPSGAKLTFVFGATLHGMWCASGAIDTEGRAGLGLTWRSLGPELVVASRFPEVGPQPVAGPYMAGPIRVRGTSSAEPLLETPHIGFIGSRGLVILGSARPGRLHSGLLRRSEERHRSILELEDVLNVHSAPIGERDRASVLVASSIEPEALAELRARIKNQVPQYLMFDEINFLETLPVRQDGMVDEEHPLLAVASSERSDIDEPKTPAEQAMAAIWRRLLSVPRVSLHDNFFDLGGYSLLPLLVINEVEQKTGVRLEPGAFLTQNLKSIAAQSGFTAKSAAEYGVQA